MKVVNIKVDLQKQEDPNMDFFPYAVMGIFSVVLILTWWLRFQDFCLVLLCEVIFTTKIFFICICFLL